MKLLLLLFIILSQPILAQECQLDLNSSGNLRFELSDILLGSNSQLADRPVYFDVQAKIIKILSKSVVWEEGARHIITRQTETTKMLGESEAAPAPKATVLSANIPISALKAALTGADDLKIVIELRTQNRLSFLGVQGAVLVREEIPLKAIGPQVVGSPCFDGSDHYMTNGKGMVFRRTIEAVP